MRALRSRLGLDAGHLSRLLRALEDEAWSEPTPSPADGRIRVARLTPSGLRRARRTRPPQRRAGGVDPGAARRQPARRARRRDADGQAPADRPRRSRSAASTPTAPTPGAACAPTSPSSTAAPTPASTPPRASRPSRTRSPLPPACSWSPTCGASRSGAARSSTIPASRRRSSGCGWRSRRAASGSPAASSPSSRPTQSASGATAARLETNKTLVEAIALYRSAGYVEVPAFNDEPFAHHWFEKRLPIAVDPDNLRTCN